MTDDVVCCVCDAKVAVDKVKKVEVKGEVKDICEECVTGIAGLM